VICLLYMHLHSGASHPHARAYISDKSLMPMLSWFCLTYADYILDYCDVASLDTPTICTNFKHLRKFLDWIFTMSLIRSASNSMDKGVYNFIYYQYHGWNLNMASIVPNISIYNWLHAKRIELGIYYHSLDSCHSLPGNLAA